MQTIKMVDTNFQVSLQNFGICIVCRGLTKAYRLENGIGNHSSKLLIVLIYNPDMW